MFEKSVKLSPLKKELEKQIIEIETVEPQDMDESNLSTSNYLSNKDLISENEARAEYITDEVM